jgi:hypothetical protein
VWQSSDILVVSELIFLLEEKCDAKLLRAWHQSSGVTSPGKVKICFDGNCMLQLCEKEQ